SLDLNESAPVNFEITETGNTMSWGAYALHPSHYEVYANGTLLYSEEWAGSNIVTNLDGLLPAGTNEIMVIAYHISGHSVNAIAIATVTDTTAPEWTVAAQDQEITEGDPFSYQLSAEDPSGIAGYAVNDTLHFQIDSSGLLTNAIDLEAGEYWLSVTASDQFGNTVEVTFKVTVLPASPTGDGMVWILLALGGGVAALLVVVVLFIKKR
ncbi:MAG: cadherin repeat domain-containing protein, partial [Candidatus Thorarchaeota archaeon]|nr:cadherin repeat domain-containing protein [Candidatus Thorarchaeota archaeon]